MAEERRTSKPAAKTDQPKEEQPKEAAPASAASPALAPASESSDPAVHQVLADLDIARRNNDDEAVERLTGRLNDLGYE